MPGTDMDTHALAADIRNLSHKIDQMQEESRDWRDKQLKIYQSMADNQKAMAVNSQRIADLGTRLGIVERELDALAAWRWKSIGILTGVILVVQWILGGA